MDLKEAITYLIRTGEQKIKVEFLQHPSLPRTLFVRDGDALQDRTIPPPDRAAKLTDLSSLLTLALDVVSDDGVEPRRPEFYVNETSVVVLLDGRDRRERITLPLFTSDKWDLLQEIEDEVGRSYTVPNLVKFFRFSLRPPADVLAAVRVVDFQRAMHDGANVAHGNEAMSKRVEAKVMQADKVPESFNVPVSVFRTAGCMHDDTVEVGVYVNVHGSTIDLHVSGDDMEAARDRALSEIATRIRDRVGDAGRVYLGSP